MTLKEQRIANIRQWARRDYHDGAVPVISVLTSWLV